MKTEQNNDRQHIDNFFSGKPYTFDKVIRMVIAALVITGMVLLVRYLSNVLVPFFIAVLLAYLIDPLVCFIQKKMRIRHRGLSVIFALLFLTLIISLILWWLIPQFMEEMHKMAQLIKTYLKNTSYHDILPAAIDEWLRDRLASRDLQKILNTSDITEALKDISKPVLQFFSGSLNILFGTLGFLIVLLYLIFILIDYPKMESSWPKLIPQKYRPLAQEVAEDLKLSMRIYFRNQFLIAMTVGVLMATGFKIIDLPMGITLGLLIGLLNIIPYLQMVGFLPAILLALLKSMETGDSFWSVLLSVFIVIAIVQIIQDTILVPKIMGKAYNMNPAIILLSLSVWGSIMGLLGMLLALPLTTLLISYYRRLIIKEPVNSGPLATKENPPGEEDSET
ncbi:AI-2E family transporter [Marinilabilia salmonicolor]|jgi:predicted PurR-regulated permease PerM|uniref:Putative PurR-regulated permease PerM n=1 Tax=Marinilabilia salmonicolor TaxID=989 RepID=A0A2T0XAC3_9BACT|nr:AI-2E family transporter [Marinilabilia salmonicolor]PRY95881.1 putative PurR-regulated permease PerM [Marinilabilia salmonicolor]RCW28900.1 putative PurR-regulated permease PerM [Marinilabilia salmonicolor]